MANRRRRRPWRALPGGMRVRTYAVLARAVEEGIACGLRRARKHVEQPTDEQVAEHVEREVMGAICEVFSFDEESDHG